MRYCPGISRALQRVPRIRKVEYWRNPESSCPARAGLFRDFAEFPDFPVKVGNRPGMTSGACRAVLMLLRE